MLSPFLCITLPFLSVPLPNIVVARYTSGEGQYTFPDISPRSLLLSLFLTHCFPLCSPSYVLPFQLYEKQTFFNYNIKSRSVEKNHSQVLMSVRPRTDDIKLIQQFYYYISSQTCKILLRIIKIIIILS